jgi:hypothetical protein
MGHTNLLLMIPAAIAAYIGGSLGTKVMHARLKPGTVKKFLGALLLILALKMSLQLLTYNLDKGRIMSQEICYCYNYTDADIRNDIIHNGGESTVLAKIIAEKHNGSCNCAIHNPESR